MFANAAFCRRLLSFAFAFADVKLLRLLLGADQDVLRFAEILLLERFDGVADAGKEMGIAAR